MQLGDGRKIRKNIAVAEIIGTILMLGIATSTMTVIYYQIKTTPTPIPTPIVEISGKIENNQIILMHQGGEPLDLDTEIVINIGGKAKYLKVEDLLNSGSKQDGHWDLGETLVYLIEYDFDYQEYPHIDINILDDVSNSLLMTGLTHVNPTCDVSVEISVDNLRPYEFEEIEFTITVTNNGNINASGILINFTLPKGLTFVSAIYDSGSYDSKNGILKIDQLLPGESDQFKIKAKVGDVIYSSSTQFVFLLDGSSSISLASWDLMLKGISAAILDDSRFSHKGFIELTVIQFGGKNPASAQLEIGPVLITDSNVDSVVDDIMNITQMGDKTPTSCAVYMAADILKASERFIPDERQVILLVTDGNPTHTCGYDGDYLSETDKSGNLTGPKDAVVEARDFLIDFLKLNEEKDEFNAISIDLLGVGLSTELVENVVWPEPGYYFPDEYPVEGPTGGWVRSISSWQEFAAAINESFKMIFNILLVDLKIQSSSFYDPKVSNDYTTLVLKPKPVFSVNNEKLPMDV